MSDVSDVLNGLIETAKDGEQGFKTAAEKAKESSLKSLFSKYASQRASYVQELQTAVSGLGEKPTESGHAAAGLHRGWINLKQALSKNEDKAIIDEAESGEDAAKKAYSEALQKTLPTDIKALVQKQYNGVLEAHGVVRDLKHGRQAAGA
ncbi:MAG: PA2169 family four-helix-bundle protein [Acidobacteriota bacterium]|nr:PA2169 family four-helix-bundle protein [Acidobacteriota bacterium]